jgi:uncharacterized SAM-binding protein YcdF (DUF218 family)
VVVALLIAAVALMAKPVLAGLGNALVEDDGVRKAQAAVVPGGDANGVRILRAAELAQAGYVPVVLVDAPHSLLSDESEVTIPYAEKHGFQADLFRALPLPGGMNSTRDEAAYVGRYLKTHGFRSILLVTSNYHSHRAAYLFRKENPWLEVDAVPAADPSFNPGSWWTEREWRKTFLVEWMKTVAAYLGI